MNYLLFKLLNIRTDHPGKIVSAGLSLRGDTSAGWLLVLAVILSIGVYFIYRHAGRDIPTGKRVTLIVLRSLFLALILAIFAGPLLALTYADSVRQPLSMLFDVSDSMGLKDLRLDQKDKVRAAIAFGTASPSGGLSQSVAEPTGNMERPTRSDVVEAVLKNNKLGLLKQLDSDYDLAPYVFDRDLRDVVLDTDSAVPSDDAGKGGPDLSTAWIDRLSSRQATASASTALGDAIREAIYRKRGQMLAGVVIATDGGSNFGSNPLEAAKFAKAEGVPLYIYGVGISNPSDIIVSNMFVEQVAFVRDELPLTVHVRSQGLKGQTAELVLKLGDQTVDQKTIDLGDDNDVDVPMKFTPDRVGDFDLTASIQPRPDEVSQTNNSTTKHIRVVDGRIKVLQIEQQPRFEFKFLQTLLLRDRRVDYHCLLLDGDPALAEAPNSPYLAKFPEKLDDLTKYDLILFGDVDPKRLPDNALTNINQFVAKFGGSFVMVAGRRFSPAAYVHTPIEDMLPVEFEVGGNTGFANANDRGIHLELTAKGKESPVLRLSDDKEASAAKWAQIPAIYWDFRVIRPKSLAEVLMVDGDVTKASRFGKMPVVALQGYGVGQVMWIGTDDLWRLRRNTFEQAYLTFWGQTIQRLSLAHMLGASKRTQLHSSNEEYATGDRVSIQARLYDSQLAPISANTVKGYLTRKGGADSDKEIVLRQLPSQAGMYQVEFAAPGAGAYSFHVETDPKTTLDFSVVEPNLEQNQTSMNEDLLRTMAQTSGGAFFREEDLNTLTSQIHHTSQPIYSSTEAELAFSPLFFLLMLGIISAEWILRKTVHLR